MYSTSVRALSISNTIAYDFFFFILPLKNNDYVQNWVQVYQH